MYTTCTHVAKHPFISLLAVSVLLMFVSSQLPAQTIDTSKLDKVTPVPPVKKGVDPDTITKTNASRIRITGVSEATVLPVTQVYIQGRGQVQRTELSYFVSVRNEGPTDENYRIVTEVHGTETVHRSPQNILLSGKNGRQNIRFQTEFTLPAGSNQLPFSVLLLNSSDAVVDRTSRQVDMTRALAADQMRVGRIFERDLAVTELTVNYRRKRMDVGPVNVARVRKLQAIATVRNAGSERWGYSASLTISYQRGRPGALSALTGPSGMTQPQTFALPAGEETVVALDAPESLTPGYYYTATAQVASRDDQNRGNNSRQFVFFLETDGSITPVDAE